MFQRNIANTKTRWEWEKVNRQHLNQLAKFYKEKMENESKIITLVSGKDNYVDIMQYAHNIV